MSICHLATLLTFIVLCVSCSQPEPSVYVWHLPDGVAPPPQASNQADVIQLGHYLFYDQRLSANQTIACATCHRPELAFTDGQPLPVGATGEPLTRNAPSLFNVGYLTRLTWADPTITSLEQQMSTPLFSQHPIEMGAATQRSEILARLQRDPATVRRFTSAFPDDADPIRWAQIITAIAAFERTLVARNSPYDRFVYQGDQTALSPSAQHGMQLFFSAGLACGHCHVDLVPPERADPPRWNSLDFLATGAGYSPDRGLAEQTDQPGDAYRFRVPPLRNVAVTAPYMHDGSLPTLDSVIDFYASGGWHGTGSEPQRAAARHDLIAGFGLSDTDRQHLLAFLASLTDQDALSDPRFSDPEAVK